MPAMSVDSFSDKRHGPRRGILLYGMYDLRGMDRAPEVRIAMMADALSHRVHMERVVGGRLGRTVAAFRWLASGGARRVGAVYVETPTSAVLPGDLAFLVLMRLLRRPVGIYFRDAYQLFRGLHPRQHRRQLIVDLVWRFTTRLLKGIATVRYAPSSGLARVLGLRDAVMLPPGTDPSLPNLGIGEPDVVVAIVQVAPRTGLDTLVAAVALVRASRPSVRLRIVARSVDSELAAALPDWVEVISAGRDSLADALRPGRVCVLPLPITAYTDLAVAVRLLDFLAFGKPIVATDTIETRALIEASGAGTVTPDTAAGLAGGILPILEDEGLARHFADNARQYACSPDATWDARAATVLATLGLDEGAAS
jgi:glycosyltransferase involved in cell wall biosynthesis